MPTNSIIIIIIIIRLFNLQNGLARGISSKPKPIYSSGSIRRVLISTRSPRPNDLSEENNSVERRRGWVRIFREATHVTDAWLSLVLSLWVDETRFEGEGRSPRDEQSRFRDSRKIPPRAFHLRDHPLLSPIRIYSTAAGSTSVRFSSTIGTLTRNFVFPISLPRPRRRAATDRAYKLTGPYMKFRKTCSGRQGPRLDTAEKRCTDRRDRHDRRGCTDPSVAAFLPRQHDLFRRRTTYTR